MAVRGEWGGDRGMSLRERRTFYDLNEGLAQAGNVDRRKENFVVGIGCVTF
jgi:hypothetical protein